MLLPEHMCVEEVNLCYGRVGMAVRIRLYVTAHTSLPQLKV